jgi:predicted site-specific integrase-resolvase
VTTTTAPTTMSGAMSLLGTTTEVISLLHCTRQTGCSCARQGLIPAVRMPDGNYIFHREEMEMWINAPATGANHT